MQIESARRRTSWLRLLVLWMGLAGLGCAQAQPADPEDPFPRRPKAPSFAGGLGWVNTAGPVELSKLKGKIVLLDFWTYCCINCMHILPDLAKLEEEFPNELVVIGVHSAKFPGEKVTDNIRQAVMRYEIKHPVVNDGDMEIWQRYGVNAWPTQVLIDPRGNFVGRASGEGNYEVIRDAIVKLIEYHDKIGSLDRTPLHFQLESYGQEETPLLFPGKIAVDAKNDRLIIADTGHHRLVIANRDGSVQKVIGTGEIGLVDGPFDQAQFFEPQGIAILDDHRFYVADRKNHAIRLCDLTAGTVATVAGTGKQGYNREETGPAAEMALASPWDLLLHDGSLYVAMAGVHQIWRMDLSNGTIGPYAGSGREDILDGDLPEANFAQPSGLATDGKRLFVADSETSAVRSIDFADKTVATLVGRGLFQFGDIDGAGDKARLQHALAVAVDGADLIYVADTYNNKLKTINSATKEVRSYLGDGKAGAGDDPPRFDEPSGLALVGRTLYVVDTNNHAIRTVDLDGQKVQTLTLSGLTPPERKASDGELPAASKKTLDPVVLARASELAISAKVNVPEGSKLNPQAPMSVRVRETKADGTKETIFKQAIATPAEMVKVNLENVDLGSAKSLEVAVTYFPCEEGSEGVCRIATQVWEIPISIGASGTDHLDLTP